MDRAATRPNTTNAPIIIDAKIGLWMETSRDLHCAASAGGRGDAWRTSTTIPSASTAGSSITMRSPAASPSTTSTCSASLRPSRHVPEGHVIVRVDEHLRLPAAVRDRASGHHQPAGRGTKRERDAHELPGLEATLVVVHGDADAVGPRVPVDLVVDQHDGPRDGLHQAVHAHRDGVARLDPVDVALGDAHLDEDEAEVHDLEDLDPRHGRDALADVDEPLRDHAAERGADGGAAQPVLTDVDLRLGLGDARPGPIELGDGRPARGDEQRGLRAVQHGPGDLVGRSGLVELALGDDRVPMQLLYARQLQRRQRDPCGGLVAERAQAADLFRPLPRLEDGELLAGRLEAGPRRRQGELVVARIDLDEDVALVHVLSQPEGQRLDAALPRELELERLTAVGDCADDAVDLRDDGRASARDEIAHELELLGDVAFRGGRQLHLDARDPADVGQLGSGALGGAARREQQQHAQGEGGEDGLHRFSCGLDGRQARIPSRKRSSMYSASLVSCAPRPSITPRTTVP